MVDAAKESAVGNLGMDRPTLSNISRDLGAGLAIIGASQPEYDDLKEHFEWNKT